MSSPVIVTLYYQAGDQSDAYIRGFDLDPLSDYWARAIAQLATARFERPFCGCGNSSSLADHWRTDTAFTGEDTYFLVDFGELANPFGTKIGERLAWKAVSSFQKKQFDAALV